MIVVASVGYAVAINIHVVIVAGALIEVIGHAVIIGVLLGIGAAIYNGSSSTIAHPSARECTTR